MTEEQKREMIQAVVSLADDARRAPADNALNYARAALHLANTIAVLDMHQMTR